MQNQKVHDGSELLKSLFIANSCSVSWDDMTGTDRARVCAGCSKTVYNLSAMSKVEAERFLSESGLNNCMTFYRRHDGTVMTDDCPIGLRIVRNQYRRVAAGISAAVGLFLSLFPWVSAVAQPAPKARQQQSLTSDMPVPVVPGQSYGGWPSGLPAPPPAALGGKPVSVISVPGTTVIHEPPNIRKMGEVERANPHTAGNSEHNSNEKRPRVKLHIEKTVVVDRAAYESFEKGQNARSQGHNVLAEFYFEMSLSAFDNQQSNGDPKFRETIRKALEECRAHLHD